MKPILFFLALAFTVNLGMAQKSKTKSQTKSKSKSASITVNISETDEAFTFSAVFDDEKTVEVNNELISTFGNSKQQSNYAHHWNNNIYSISTAKGAVNINLDKTKASAKVERQVKDVVDRIRNILGDLPPPPPPAPPAPPAPPID